jgi:MFS family permease
VSSLPQQDGMFIAARGIIGFGLGFNITAAPILIMELAFPTQKAPMVSIYNSLWSLGAIVAAWTTYGTFRIMNNWAWRIPSILQALSSIIQIVCFWWIVESPRWLVSKDRCDEAQAIITRVCSSTPFLTLDALMLYTVPCQQRPIRSHCAG